MKIMQKEKPVNINNAKKKQLACQIDWKGLCLVFI
jgi:hypothetical protein